jgi:hypothetical protein
VTNARLEEATVLELGARGRFRGAPFVLSGRTCVRSKAGGLWNEWTMRFDDGHAATLAEARGAFTVYVERAIAPPPQSLAVGGALDTGYVVVERGEATRAARWGDEDAAPDVYPYADLSSRSGEVATIDYGEPAPRTFVGTKTTLDALELAPRRERAHFFAMKKTAAPKGWKPALAIDDEGTLDGTRFRVIGIVRRSIRVDGTRYAWEEYLLHEAAAGFMWLVATDGHWNVVTPVEPGLVTYDDERAVYEGAMYEYTSHGTARLEWAEGELPWDASIGETTTTTDYVRAPHLLSFEATDDEILWSRSTWTSPDTIARAFDKPSFPRPKCRAPNQPRSTKPSRR